MWRAVEQQIFTDSKAFFYASGKYWPMMKSEKRKLLINCFWACWSKAMCFLGSIFQTCRPHAQVLSCSARIFARVPLWIYPFLFEILYFAATPKLAEGGEIAALGIAGAKAQTLVLNGRPLWEDGSFEGQETAEGMPWKHSRIIYPLIIYLCDGGEVPHGVYPLHKLHLQAFCSLALGVPSPASAWPPQVYASYLCILPCPRSLDASPGSWHQEEFSPRFRGTKNLPLIEVDTVGVSSSICF